MSKQCSALTSTLSGLAFFLHEFSGFLDVFLESCDVPKIDSAKKNMRKSERYSTAQLRHDGGENETASLQAEEEPNTPRRAYNQLDGKEDVKQELRE